MNDQDQYTHQRSARPRLRRSRSDRMIAGVCGGIGRYLNVDPVIVRVAWVVLTIITGFELLLIYFLAMILVPEERPGDQADSTARSPQSAKTLMGLGLIAVGALLLATELIPWFFDTPVLGPILLVAAGVFVLTRRGNR